MMDRKENVGIFACREYCLLCVGIGCLQLFVENNWVGPPTASPVENLTTTSHNAEKVKILRYL